MVPPARRTPYRLQAGATPPPRSLARPGRWQRKAHRHRRGSDGKACVADGPVSRAGRLHGEVLHRPVERRRGRATRFNSGRGGRRFNVVLTRTTQRGDSSNPGSSPLSEGLSLTIRRIRKDRKSSRLLPIPSRSRSALPGKSTSARETCRPSSPPAIARPRPWPRRLMP